MHSLFSLILCFLPITSRGGDGFLQFTFEKENQIQYREIDVPKETATFTLQSPSIAKVYQISLAYAEEKLDLSTRNLVDINGVEHLLSSYDNGIRKIISPTVEANWGSHILSLNSRQDIAPSLLSQSSIGIVYQYLAFNGATIFLFSHNRFTQNLPESYFTDPQSLQKRRRQTRVEGQSSSIGIEQILSENWKGRAELGITDMPNYRPRQNTQSVASAYSLNSRWTLKNELGYSSESKEENLQDDRGYFNATWLDNQIAFEWKLDSFVSVGWNTVEEREEDPRRNLSTRLGTDSFILEFDQALQEFSYQISLAVSRSSDGDNATSGKGGVKWVF